MKFIPQTTVTTSNINQSHLTPKTTATDSNATPDATPSVNQSHLAPETTATASNADHGNN